jgi:hypothetical protein
MSHNNKPSFLKSILTDVRTIIVTVVGGVLLAIIIQSDRFAPERSISNITEVAAPTVSTPTLTRIVDPGPRLNVNDSLHLSHILSLPNQRALALEKASIGWSTGVTADMIEANYEYTEEVKEMFTLLAGFYPPNHFGEEGAEAYFESEIQERHEFHRRELEPDGVGTGGTMVTVMAGASANADLEEMIVAMVRSITMNVDDFDFLAWKKQWDEAAEVVQ